MVDPRAGFFVVAAFQPRDAAAAGAVIDSVEACAILGVNANHLRQMKFRGDLTAVGKRGRRLLFDRDAVLALRDARAK